jgi:hypothetical protein
MSQQVLDIRSFVMVGVNKLCDEVCVTKIASVAYIAVIDSQIPSPYKCTVSTMI